jgi:hypothetical protein
LLVEDFEEVHGFVMDGEWERAGDRRLLGWSREMVR